ncbi:LLM class flavin-dependent oxidoreductase [Streptomyces sp. SudanB91_2054]|uniref:LLM class flavin-dependent oxidoreductase n=1 Tax=Streptomyces sp. SudanB91_2054 TaxID=3035278 RepID=UPI0036DABE8F
MSLFFPVMPLRPDIVEGFARIVRDAGLARLWMGQSLTFDTYHLFAYLAGRGLKVPTGTAVTVMPLRHPYEAAVEARSVALFTGQPMTAGFGPGAVEFVTSLRGSGYRSPLTASREYLSMVRSLVRGEPVELNGEYHSLHGMLPPLPDAPPVDVGVGVLRAGMAKVAGEVADAAITWLTPLPYILDVLAPAMRQGAQEQDRKPPRIVSLVHFGVDRPGRDARRLVLAANDKHLGTRHYTAMLRSAGLKADPQDPAGGADALVESGVFLTGSAQRIAERVIEHLDAGVDEVVLSPGGVLLAHGEQAALADLREVVSALGGSARA